METRALIEGAATIVGTGSYRVAALTGATTGITAGGTVFQLSMAIAAAAKTLVALTRLRVQAQVTTLFTAPQRIGYDVVKFRTASGLPTGGNAITLPTCTSRPDTALPASMVGDLRVATTATLTINDPGTSEAVDPFPFATSIGWSVDAVAGLPLQHPLLDFEASNYVDPMYFGAAEGFRVRPVVSMGAAGVMFVTIEAAFTVLQTP